MQRIQLCKNSDVLCLIPQTPPAQSSRQQHSVHADKVSRSPSSAPSDHFSLPLLCIGGCFAGSRISGFIYVSLCPVLGWGTQMWRESWWKILFLVAWAGSGVARVTAWEGRYCREMLPKPITASFASPRHCLPYRQRNTYCSACRASAPVLHPHGSGTRGDAVGCV